MVKAVKVVGTIFSLGGLGSFIYFLIHYVNNSGSTSIAGHQIAHHGVGVWPVIVCGVVMIIGVIILLSAKE
jgi:hypothetical protein